MPADTSDLHARACARVDELAGPLRDLALRIHARPELRFAEHFAAQWVAETVEAAGITVERGLAAMPTALRARAGDADGSRIAYLAEYDALPDVGHACGHNLIAAAAVGAFLAVAPVAAEAGGGVDLLGTPAEEGGGGKILLLEAGAFDGIDAAMMVHPFDRDLLAHPTLAELTLSFVFRGEASHAAIAPWEGRSALTACLQTFSLVDSQRVHFRDGVRVHGRVTDGGQANNIIPERAACEINVRATFADELDRVRTIVERCGRAAALAAGVEVAIELHRGYREMNNNMPLAAAFGKHFARFGRDPRALDPTAGCGSTDMGDVSQRLPAIHPWVAICAQGVAQCHQRPFADAAKSNDGLATMLLAAKAMACAGVDFLADETLRAEVTRAFASRPSP